MHGYVFVLRVNVRMFLHVYIYFTPTIISNILLAIGFVVLMRNQLLFFSPLKSVFDRREISARMPTVSSATNRPVVCICMLICVGVRVRIRVY